MKIVTYLLFVLLMASCTKKYETFHAIKKNQFIKDEPHNPVMPKLRPGRFVVQESCEGQIFWTRNAKKITDNNLIALIQYSCPGSEYLLNAKITEMWWTTIVYSRSCIKLESYCPFKPSK